MTDMSIAAPESFVSVCQILYGDLVDPDVVWQTVAKRSPDQADLNTGSDRRKRMVTAGLSAVGAGAGALGLGVGAKEVARHGWKATPKLTRALVPAEVVGLGGEVMATRILHGDAQKKPKTLVPTGNVNKAFKLPNMSDIVTGSRKAMRGVVDAAQNKVRTTGPQPGTPEFDQHLSQRAADRATRVAGKPVGADAAAARQRGVDRWGKVGGALGEQSAHPKRVAAAAIGTGAAVGGGAVAVNRKRKKDAANLAAFDSTTLAPYGKSYSFEAEGTIAKIDDDKHLVFGWLSVSKINGAVVVDKQNDYIDPGDLEEAAYAYVHGSRVGGDMHGRGDDDTPRKVSDLVESVVFTPEKIEKMGLPADFPVGWWGGFKVHDEAAWEDVKKGRRTGFSVHGKGRRTDVDLDELMGV